MNFEIDLNTLSIGELKNIISLVERKTLNAPSKKIKRHYKKQRHFSHWTQGEVETLIKEFNMGNSRSRIAKLLSKKNRAVYAKIYRLHQGRLTKVDRLAMSMVGNIKK